MDQVEATRDPTGEGSRLLHSPFRVAGIDATTIFLPDRALAELEQLAAAAWRQRQRKFVMTALWFESDRPDAARRSGFCRAFERYKALPKSTRRRLCEHPAFRVWLMQAGRIAPLPSAAEPALEAQVVRKLEQFGEFLAGFLSPGGGMENGDEICLRRFDVEDLIAEVAPPSYDFTAAAQARARDASNPYTLTFFKDVLEALLRRVGLVSPGLAQVIPRFVRMIIHLPNADFRSCSAQRFAGAIMMTTDEDNLLALEESLIHEFGHQILYAVMELDPLVGPAGDGMFSLPWSGAQRDAYGYFHATYIYLILALFMEAAQDRFADEAVRVRSRLRQILLGLEAALPDFKNADFFTPTGARFFDRMQDISRELLMRNRQLIASA